MKAADWIDQVKEARGWDSDYRAAKELGLSRNSISGYRAGVRTFDDATATKVAQALNIEPEIIVLDQVAERTPVDAVREGVTRVLDRIRGKARNGGAGARAPLDITSVTAATDAGELRAPRSKGYASYKLPKGFLHAHPLQQLQRAVASMLSYSPPLASA